MRLAHSMADTLVTPLSDSFVDFDVLATLRPAEFRRHRTAREKVMALLNAPHLPLSENGRRRAAARAEWYSVMDQPLQVHDLLA
jgi:hypothetical protein